MIALTPKSMETIYGLLLVATDHGTLGLSNFLTLTKARSHSQSIKSLNLSVGKVLITLFRYLNSAFIQGVNPCHIVGG